MRFLIWSIEHGGWWGPARRGYVQDPRDAGRYARDEAEDIVTDANIVSFNECLIPVACVLPEDR
jgi:hypothetical protein